MFEPYFKKARKFIFDPKQVFKKEGNSNLEYSFKYMIIIGLVTAIITTVIAIVAEPALAVWGAVNFVGYYIALIVGFFIGGIWLHLWVYIFGGRKGLEQTLKIMAFGGTPGYLFAWISSLVALVALSEFIYMITSLIAVVIFVWQLGLYYHGIKTFHKLGKERTTAALIIYLIPVLILILGLTVVLPSTTTFFTI